MTDARYLQEGFQAQVAHVAEEIGEAMKVLGDITAAIGKAGRWGWESVNPELEPEVQETNREWLARALCAASPELDDVNLTIGRLRQTMGEEPPAYEVIARALDALDIPSPLSDLIGELFELGVSPAYKAGMVVLPERLISRGLEGIRRRDVERYDEADTDDDVNRELVRACLSAVFGFEVRS